MPFMSAITHFPEDFRRAGDLPPRRSKEASMA